jgi:hypothetical protein
MTSNSPLASQNSKLSLFGEPEQAPLPFPPFFPSLFLLSFHPAGQVKKGTAEDREQEGRIIDFVQNSTG